MLDLPVRFCIQFANKYHLHKSLEIQLYRLLTENDLIWRLSKSMFGVRPLQSINRQLKGSSHVEKCTRDTYLTNKKGSVIRAFLNLVNDSETYAPAAVNEDVSG